METGGLPSAIKRRGVGELSSQLIPIFGPLLANAADPSALFATIPNSITRGCTATTPSILDNSSGSPKSIGAALSRFPNGISDRTAKS